MSDFVHDPALAAGVVAPRLDGEEPRVGQQVDDALDLVRSSSSGSSWSSSRLAMARVRRA